MIDRPAHFSQLAESFLQDGAATGLLPLLVDANGAMDMYGDIVEHRPHRVVERFVELGHDARDRGYRGLCAVADVTPLLATA